MRFNTDWRQANGHAAMVVIIVIVVFHQHDGDPELHPGEHNAVEQPQQENRQDPDIRVRHQMPKVHNVEIQQQRDENRRQDEPDRGLADIELDQIWHGAPLRCLRVR